MSQIRRPAQLVQVELEVSSWIEGRGVRHTNWSVRVRDAWIPVAQLRGVAATIADPDVSFDDDVDELLVIPPGCQYRITYHLRVPVGTRLRRRISAPCRSRRVLSRPPTTTAEAVQQFRAAIPPVRPLLKTTFADFRVGRARRLIAEAQWQTAQRARHPSREVGELRTAVSAAEIDAFVSTLARTHTVCTSV